MSKIKVRVVESFVTYVVRDSYEIDTDDYSELEGMSEDEVKEYIRENSFQMEAPKEFEYSESLYEVLSDRAIISNDISEETDDIVFD